VTYDFPAVKARIDLETLFREDGHELKRVGGKWRCKSPFNRERTPSCYIDPDRGRFKCFSSGSSGDIFDYFMQSRGCDREAAYAELARRAGVISDASGNARPLAPVKMREPEPEKVLVPMTGDDAARWHEGVEKLILSQSTRAHIARWRGLSEQAVFDLAYHGRVGNPLMPAWVRRQDAAEGDRRVSFPVEAMIDGHLQLVAFHMRLKPREPGARASWRFVPSGVGAWPYILGDALTAKLLVICEGQWDAMAIFDAMGVTYAQLLEEKVAICAMRGAANWRLFAEHFLLARGPRRSGTSALVICDADQAGEEWTTPSNDEPGFVAVLKEVCGHVAVREPAEGTGKDLNDVWKLVQGGVR